MKNIKISIFLLLMGLFTTNAMSQGIQQKGEVSATPEKAKEIKDDLYKEHKITEDEFSKKYPAIYEGWKKDNLGTRDLIEFVDKISESKVEKPESKEEPLTITVPASSPASLETEDSSFEKINLANDPATLNDLAEAYELGQVSEKEISKILIQEKLTLEILTKNNIDSKSKFYGKVNEQIQLDK
jgi:hypothetical protein